MKKSDITAETIAEIFSSSCQSEMTQCNLFTCTFPLSYFDKNGTFINRMEFYSAARKENGEPALRLPISGDIVRYYGDPSAPYRRTIRIGHSKKRILRIGFRYISALISNFVGLNINRHLSFVGMEHIDGAEKFILDTAEAAEVIGEEGALVCIEKGETAFIGFIYGDKRDKRKAWKFVYAFNVFVSGRAKEGLMTLTAKKVEEVESGDFHIV